MQITSSTDNPQEKKKRLLLTILSLESNCSILLLGPKCRLGNQPRSNVDLVTSFFHRENRNASISRIGIASQQLPQDVNLQQYTSNQLKAIKRANATGIEDEKTELPAIQHTVQSLT